MGRVTEGYVSPIKAAVLDHNWRSKLKVSMLTSYDAVEDALLRCGSEDPFAADTETTSLDYNLLDLVGFSFCYNRQESFYVPFGHKIGKNVERRVLDRFIQFLMNHQGKVLFYGYHFDGRVLRKYGLDIDKLQYFDVMPLVWNVDTNVHMPALKPSAKYYLGLESEDFTEILGGAKDASQLTPEQLCNYAAYDPFFTLGLALHLLPFYNKNKFIVDLDNATIRSMIDYEDTLVHVDMQKVREMEQSIRLAIAKLETEIYQIAGQFFKIGSPEVLAHVLQSLGIDTGKSTPKKGYMSTSIDDLEPVKKGHYIVPRIIEYKELVKKLSTYVEPLAKASQANLDGVRFQYQTTNVPTGRLSSGVGKNKVTYFADMNIQSFPKPDSVRYRAEKSDALDNILGYKFIEDSHGKYESFESKDNVREFLIGYPGHYVVAIDFIMEEIVIAANLSKDPAFLEPLKKGEDVHDVTAKFMFPEQHITKALRKIAKTCNFGLLYGGNEYTLRNQLPDKSLEKCRDYYLRWFQLHHYLWNSYMPRIKSEARTKGYTQDLFGRIRRVAYWYALGNPRDSGFADRTVWNTQVQGLAGDVMRVALVRMWKHLYRKPEMQDKIKFMASMHDELVLSITKDPALFTEILHTLVKDLTELPFKWEVPFTVSIAVGNSWGKVFEFAEQDGVWSPVVKEG